MSELCRFLGIVIRIYAPDHPPPHFHAVYGEYEAQIDIRTIEISEGYLPSRSRRMVLEWASLHQEELVQAWDRCSNGLNPGKIAPLS